MAAIFTVRSATLQLARRFACVPGRGFEGPLIRGRGASLCLLSPTCCFLSFFHSSFYLPLSFSTFFLSLSLPIYLLSPSLLPSYPPNSPPPPPFMSIPGFPSHSPLDITRPAKVPRADLGRPHQHGQKDIMVLQ